MSPRRIRVFISYSHADERWKNRLVRHLRVFAAQGDLAAWDDSQIEAGSDWKAAIDAALAEADVAVLLVSADFLTSPFILDHEVARILERRKAEGVRVVPLLVAPCPWTAVDWLANLQVRPAGARPLSLGTRAQSERDLARLALEIRALGIDEAPVTERIAYRVRELTIDLPRVGLALLPAVAAMSFAAIASSTRVPTDVELDMTSRSLMFTVGGDEPVQVLNNSTRLSRLAVEDCGLIALPPFRVEPTGQAQDVDDVVTLAPPAPSAVRLTCDPSISGSKVLFRPPSDDASVALGTLGRVPIQPGDQVSLEVTAATRPYVRLEVSRKSSIGFVFEPAPFEIVSEFVSIEGASPAADGSVRRYRASLVDDDGERVANIESALALKLVMVPAPGVGADAIFRNALDIPMTTVSLFQRSEVDDRFVSTAITGSLTYPSQPNSPAMAIENGDSVSLHAESGFRLTRLGLQEDGSALTFSMRGIADEAQTEGVDRRVTLLQAVLVNRTMLVLAISAVVLMQLLSLRRFWPARNRWS
jgi:hypothetical protein